MWEDVLPTLGLYCEVVYWKAMPFAWFEGPAPVDWSASLFIATSASFA